MSRCLLLRWYRFRQRVLSSWKRILKIPSAVVLQPDRTTDLISHSLQSECKSKCDPVDLCATDSNLDCRGTEDRKETFEQILEYLYRAG